MDSSRIIRNANPFRSSHPLKAPWSNACLFFAIWKFHCFVVKCINCTNDAGIGIAIDGIEGDVFILLTANHITSNSREYLATDDIEITRRNSQRIINFNDNQNTFNLQQWAVASLQYGKNDGLFQVSIPHLVVYSTAYFSYSANRENIKFKILKKSIYC